MCKSSTCNGLPIFVYGIAFGFLLSVVFVPRTRTIYPISNTVDVYLEDDTAVLKFREISRHEREVVFASPWEELVVCCVNSCVTIPVPSYLTASVDRNGVTVESKTRSTTCEPPRKYNGGCEL
jgi:hypothetical protein